MTSPSIDAVVGPAVPLPKMPVFYTIVGFFNGTWSAMTPGTDRWWYECLLHYPGSRLVIIDPGTSAASDPGDTGKGCTACPACLRRASEGETNQEIQRLADLVEPDAVAHRNKHSQDLSVIHLSVFAAEMIVKHGPHRWLRPSVFEFACRMEDTLRRHDGSKGGQKNWRKDTALDLLNRLEEEVEELRLALQTPGVEPRQCSKEAVDVANFALMVSDVCDPLPNDVEGAGL